jgi:hypothetical protein
MNDDPLKRARQALEVSGASRSQLPARDPTKVDELLARVRAGASDREARREPPPEKVAASSDREARREPPPEVTPMAMATDARRANKVRVPITCGKTGRSFIGHAERQGDDLLLVDHEVSQAGRGASTRVEMLSGKYRVSRVSDWACPLCKSSDDLWSCQCRENPNALHCGGRRGRASYCACGRLEERYLEEAEFLQVRGQSVAARSKSGPSEEPRSPSNVPTIFRNR